MKPKIKITDVHDEAKRYALHVRIDRGRLDRYRASAGSEPLSRWVLRHLDEAANHNKPQQKNDITANHSNS